MTTTDRRWTAPDRFALDVEGLRRGDYSDKYFANVVRVLGTLADEGYTYAGSNPRQVHDAASLAVGDVVVEAQVFHRHRPFALVAGMDIALAMLVQAAGSWQGDTFVPAWDELEVEAVHDGQRVAYTGDAAEVVPVLKIRGRYRTFAMLETPMLGVLSRATRIATSVLNVLDVSNGKDVLFFPARFDLAETQAVDGYAYWLAVQHYNDERPHQPLRALVSTDAQGRYYDGRGGGTTPHSLIASFLGDDAEMMLQYARILPANVPRTLLVDFNNDVIASARLALQTLWPHYLQAAQQDDDEGMRRWSLDGVRIDTSAQMQDVSMAPDGPYGNSTQLVRLMRQSLDDAWQRWDVSGEQEAIARRFCQQVSIMVSGGFDAERIARFETEGAPVDSYGVGSTFLRNDTATNTDYTMDIVRVQHEGRWHDMAKTGRQPNFNGELERVEYI